MIFDSIIGLGVLGSGHIGQVFQYVMMILKQIMKARVTCGTDIGGEGLQRTHMVCLMMLTIASAYGMSDMINGNFPGFQNSNKKYT